MTCTHCVTKKIVCDEVKSIVAAYLGVLFVLYLMALSLLIWLLTTSEGNGASELDDGDGDDALNIEQL